MEKAKRGDGRGENKAVDQDDFTLHNMRLPFIGTLQPNDNHTHQHHPATLGIPDCYTQSPKPPHPSLVVGRWFVLCINGQHLLHELVSLILQPLSHSDLPSVETLPICAVDGLRRRRPTEQGGGECEHSATHTHTHTYIQRYTHTFTMCIKKKTCVPHHMN